MLIPETLRQAASYSDILSTFNTDIKGPSELGHLATPFAFGPPRLSAADLVLFGHAQGSDLVNPDWIESISVRQESTVRFFPIPLHPFLHSFDPKNVGGF